MGSFGGKMHKRKKRMQNEEEIVAQVCLGSENCRGPA